MIDNSLLLDAPIESDDEDKLERTKIADAITDTILNYEKKSITKSITIGIEGSWGSGKTSVINLVKDRIIKRYKPDIWKNYDSYVFSSTIPSEIKPLIINFNPWIYSSEEKLLSDFFRLICHAVARRNIWIATTFWFHTSEHLRRILETSKLGLVTSILSAIAAGCANTLNIFRFELDNKKNGANKILNNFDEKIFVIIDDIDRLDADETLLIFKLTKVVADFHNIIFILAYDKEKTIQKINAKFEGDINSGAAYNYEVVGDNFIDKIVQYHFYIPYTRTFNYEKYFVELAATINEYSNIEILDEYFWKDIYSNYLCTLLYSPRNAKQYMNNIMINLNIIDAKEINFLDFLLIEAVRIYAINVYNSIISNILELVHDERAFVTGNVLDEETHYSLLEEICDKSTDSNKNIITNILSYLFPFKKAQYEDTLRICSKSHYNKYFTMSLDPTSISEKEIAVLKNKLKEGSNIFVESTKKIFEDIADENRRSAYSRIIDSIEKYNDIQLINLLPSLLELSEKNIWSLSIAETRNFAYRILERIDCTSRKESLLCAIRNINIVHLDLYFLAYLGKIRELNNHEDLLSRDDLEELCSTYIKELEYEYKIPRELTNRNDIQMLLEFWFKYGKEDDFNSAKRFALSLLESKDTLIELLWCHYDNIVKPIGVKRHNLSEYFDDITVVNKLVNMLDKNKLNRKEADIIDWYQNSLNR